MDEWDELSLLHKCEEGSTASRPTLQQQEMPIEQLG
jgi:hypothetical protein